MPTVTQHTPGAFCWFELGTTDIAAARAFYTALFDWTLREDPTGASPYTMFRIGEDDVAAGYDLMPQQREAGVPAHWLQYVSVASAEHAAARARENGGQVLMGPMDVMDIGRMAVLRDPQGATFAVWEPRRHIGVTRVNEPNTRCWSELATRDTDAAARFYTAVLPWRTVTEPMGPITYTRFRTVDGDAGGMLKLDGAQGDMPTYWMVYFAVADCDAVAARAVALGAELRVGPFDAGGVGRCAVLSDPQGAVFSIIRLSARG